MKQQDAYELGVKVALSAAGLIKISTPLAKILTHPVALGAGFGTLGGLLSGGTDPLLERALRGAATGGTIGAGIRYLPRLLARVPHLGAGGRHARHIGDISWMAPSLALAPVISRVGRRSSRAS